MTLRQAAGSYSCSSRGGSWSSSSSSRSAESIKVPPTECTCSLVSDMMSYAHTSAPRRCMVAIACSPATAAPRTMAFAAGVVPAAVESVGTYLPKVSALMMAHLYPAIEPIDESASMLCATPVRDELVGEDSDPGIGKLLDELW